MGVQVGCLHQGSTDYACDTQHDANQSASSIAQEFVEDMEVLALTNRMSAITFLSFYFSS